MNLMSHFKENIDEILTPILLTLPHDYLIDNNCSFAESVILNTL